MNESISSPHDRSIQGFQGKPDPVTGLYDVGGTKRPRVAVGTGNVLAFKDEQGEWKALVSRRAGGLENAGAWNLLGGYVNIQDGESPTQGARREVREESKDRIDLQDMQPIPLTPYMNYNDAKNGQCLALGMLFILSEEQGKDIRQAIADHAMTNSEAHDFRIISLTHLASSLEELERSGGLAFPQARMHLEESQKHVRELDRVAGLEANQKGAEAPKNFVRFTQAPSSPGASRQFT